MFGLELYYGLIAHCASLLGDSAHNIGDALIIGGSIFVMGSTMRVKAKVALIKAVIMLSFGLLAMGYEISNATSGYVPNPEPITYVGIFVLIGNIISKNSNVLLSINLKLVKLYKFFKKINKS